MRCRSLLPRRALSFSQNENLPCGSLLPRRSIYLSAQVQSRHRQYAKEKTKMRDVGSAPDAEKKQCGVGTFFRRRALLSLETKTCDVGACSRVAPLFCSPNTKTNVGNMLSENKDVRCGSASDFDFCFSQDIRSGSVCIPASHDDKLYM